jgi:choline kinase
MRAILIGAGQGTRLRPHTLEMPKCLVPVGGRPIIDWQIDALHHAGITEIVVVGGYRAPQIRQHIARMPAACRPKFIHNPFWSVSSSIGSVWAARSSLDRPFCLLNGDVVVAPGLLDEALAGSSPGVNLVVEPAPTAEPDDMRVMISGGLVRRVNKDLAADVARHRSLGVIICKGGGALAYGRALEDVMTKDGGHMRYHHDVIDALAQAGRVKPALFGDHGWLEIDRPEDIVRWERRHGVGAVAPLKQAAAG